MSFMQGLNTGEDDSWMADIKLSDISSESDGDDDVDFTINTTPMRPPCNVRKIVEGGQKSTELKCSPLRSKYINTIIILIIISHTFTNTKILKSKLMLDQYSSPTGC